MAYASHFASDIVRLQWHDEDQTFPISFYFNVQISIIVLNLYNFNKWTGMCYNQGTEKT